MKGTTFLDFVEFLSRNEGWGLDKGALERYLKTDGRAVVVFDGLDEIFDPEDREAVARRIVGFTLDYPKARVLVTSRVIGYRRKVLADGGFSHFTLQDLDERQVAEFVDRWYSLALSDRPDEAQARRERILRSFGESASIRQLAGNPMLLTIMAIIGKHQELPRERWKLYDHAAGVLIQHWDVNKHLKDEQLKADFIGEDDKKELLRRLAYKMQSGEGGLAGNYIHREQLQAEFEAYLKERYAETPARAKTIAEAMINQFRERNFILSLYGARLYGLVHRAFLEFFCASAFVHKFEKTRELSLEGLKEVYGAHWEDRSWHEVLRLICGIIDEKFAGELIDYLSTEVYRSWPKKFGDRPPLNIELAVRCLSEIRDPNTVAEPAGRLLEVICSIFDKVTIDDWNMFSYIEQQIIPSAESIGVNWPRRMILIEWLKQRTLFRENNYVIARLRGTFVGMVGDGLEELYRMIISLTLHEDESHRYTALNALARGWYNESQTVQSLHQLIKDDRGILIRPMAVNTLAEHFSNNPETLPLLRYLSVEDKNDNVRIAALLKLAENFADDENTLPLLRERTVNDNPSTQAATLRAQAQFFTNDAGTLPLLHDALNSKSDEVRKTVIWTLAEYYRDEPQTLALLRDRAVNDKSPSARDPEFQTGVRGMAIEALAKHWGSHPDTLPLLRERAENDPTPQVREQAKELADELEKNVARRG